MKYPPTCHVPSFSRIAVTDSTAAAFWSKLALNWKTTYSPSGAPGSVVVEVALFNVRYFNRPNGARAVCAADCHFSWVMAFRNSVAAVSQLAW